MKFRAGALEFNATVAEASESPSPQTGDPLRTLTIQFRAQKTAMHEQALEQAEVRHSGGLFSLDAVDRTELEWRVRESTSSYVGTEPWGMNHHVWLIEQVERLACSQLLIGSIALEPYEYAEAVSAEGVVRLVARAPIAAADLDALSALEARSHLESGPGVSAGIPVTRVGISDIPREMTLAYVWGEKPEGLAVVIRCMDATEPRLTLDMATPSVDVDVVSDLLTVLSRKGVLDEANLEDLRRRRHAARRVANIEGWTL